MCNQWAAGILHKVLPCKIQRCCCLLVVTLAGMYYLRTRAAADAIKFTVDQQALPQKNKQQQQPEQQQLMSPSRQQPAAAAILSPSRKLAAMSVAGDGSLTHEEREAQMAKMVCSLENREACLMCSG